MKKPITNLTASVRARLLNRAKAEGRPFDELLQYYAMERFLYRLSRSEHAGQFVLKGALMLQIWGGPLARATKDIDLLGRMNAPASSIAKIVRECLATDVPDDGLHFEPSTVTGEEIRLAANYNGVRIRCRALLGTARVALQIDVGFGDIITPAPVELEYPTLLEFDAPRLFGYPPETVIAEKLEAMVVLDMANTRLKDFLDIWILSEHREFAGSVLAKAIEATFRRRKTELPSETPVALTPAFYAAPSKRAQWLAYVRKTRIPTTPPPFDEVAIRIGELVTPLMNSIRARTSAAGTWPPGGPWEA